MKIIKHHLASLKEVYTVSLLKLDGKTHFLAATEAHGPCLLFQSPEWKPSVVWNGPGGAMGIVPLEEKTGSFLAIQEFFPVFKSESAGIVYVEAGLSIEKPWKMDRLLDLPFVHRFDVVSGKRQRYLVAATLCGGKDFQEDWSSPGAVYAGPVPLERSGPWSLKPILQGISKNHGMHITRLDEKTVVLVSGQEGLFQIDVPPQWRSDWHHEQLLDHEISDISTLDIDGNGCPEIVAIEPFHGDGLVIYKRKSRGWEAVMDMPMDFGHVVWGGPILGKPAIVAGNRGGQKELFLLFPSLEKNRGMERVVIDRDVGPAQIAVLNEPHRTLLFSANHAAGEVALYEILL
jgi:hypothetical protein